MTEVRNKLVLKPVGEARDLFVQLYEFLDVSTLLSRDKSDAYTHNGCVRCTRARFVRRSS
eukprot:SAG11_NODE_5833_length_1453_cov_1.203840_2_plen_59_part_01